MDQHTAEDKARFRARHAIERARERYALDLSFEDLDRMQKRLAVNRSGCFRATPVAEAHLLLHVVENVRIPMIAMFDPVDKVIMTFIAADEALNSTPGSFMGKQIKQFADYQSSRYKDGHRTARAQRRSNTTSSLASRAYNRQAFKSSSYD